MTTGDATALATTRLKPPHLPASHVERPRLSGALRHSVRDPGVKVVLVSAPAGTGKTTLLADLAVQSDGPAVGWLQLDEGDDDPARFWSAVAAAIAAARPDVATKVQAVARTTRGHRDSVVAALVNAAAEADPFVLVLDDYHLVEDDEVHLGVDQLIGLLPPPLTLVISTRVDPPLRIGRLRVRGQLHEVRGADLRMDPEAARALLGPDAAGLGDPDVAALCERTEGWAAGLVLAGLSLRRSDDPHAFVAAFGGDDRLVVDYLGDELFSALDPVEHERLVVTSVADRLCGDLVDHLTGGDDGARWLAALAAVNQLLVPLDATGTWFRHHQLVLDLLRTEAQLHLGPRLPELHDRAAGWFRDNGAPEAAVRHWIAAGQEPKAAALLGGGLGWWMIAGGEHATLRRVLDRLGDAPAGHMGAALQVGWCSLIANDVSAADVWLDRAQALRTDPDPDDDALFDSLEIFIELARGDVAGAAAIAQRALASSRLPEQFSPMATTAGAALAWAGRLDDARRALAIAKERSRQDGAAANEVMAAMYLALVEAEVGDRGPARAAAERAIELATARGLDRYPRTAVAYALRAATAPEAASGADDVARALDLVSTPVNVLDEALVVTVAADLALAADRPTGPGLLARATELVAACHDPGVVGARLARVRARHGAAAAPVDAVPDLVEQLTDRELAVLHYLPSRLSQREIADELYVSLNTVKTHCRAIFRKLAVTDRKLAVQRARELDLLR